MSEEEQQQDNYTPGEKVDMKTIMEQDAEDESLRKYKEALLGNVAEAYAPADDDRRVVITELRIIFADRPDGDIVYPLDTPESIAELKKKPFTIKEGSKYKMQVSFRVQHEIVSGLCFQNNVYKGPLKVTSDKEMLGSYGPKEAPYTVTTPRRGWEEAPSGALARGNFKARSSFMDDDKAKHLEYEYTFKIGKGW
mmetsp:Transcript_119910/g.168796  ORF Transcript_119910/g.168796 Transcript_119910/m.168796 type:complete len:195 (+) Transcript_119910:83-667(+)